MQTLFRLDIPLLSGFKINDLRASGVIILLHSIQAAAGRPGWGPAPQLMVIYICRHTLSEWDNDYRSEQAQAM